MSRQIDKKSFTILELLIVVLIIGLSYSLVISKFSKDQKKVSSFLSLKQDLEKIKKKEAGDSLDLICQGDNCEDCKIIIDKEEIENKPKLFNKKPKVYEFDKNGYLEEKKYQEKICFIYQLFSNNSSTNMFLEYDGKYYIFYPAVYKTKKFLNYDEALKEYEPKGIIPTENSQFYKD